MIDDAFRPDHPRWQEFCDRLLGPEGCDANETTLICAGDTRACVRILHAMGATEAVVDDALRYFRKRGGYCDCEVLINVVARENAGASGERETGRAAPGTTSSVK